MQKTALFAVFALMAACAVAPEPGDHTTQAAEVQQAAFTAIHDLAFHVVDESSTYLQRVEDRVPADIPSDAVREISFVRDPETDRAAIAIDFTDAGARLAHEVTARAVGRRLAVVVDNHVVAQPVIRQPIDGARALITLDEGAAATWQIGPGHW
jgi:preprotein translocase subunit SecD